MFLELQEFVAARDVWCRCAAGLIVEEFVEGHILLGLRIGHTIVFVGLAVPFLVMSATLYGRFE